MEPKCKYKTVMVVDDNQIDRYVAKMTMERTAFAETVVCMESAMEALEYLKSPDLSLEDLPHFIFLDINMPEMSGFDFLNEYKDLSETVKKHCIIMMLTTSLNYDDQVKAENNQFVYRFLNKPLDKEKLGQIE